MNTPTPEDQPSNFESRFVLHPMTEFDVAADLGYKDVAPSGEFTRCEHIHALTEFDCSQRIEEGGEVALRLTFHLPSDEPSLSVVRDVSDLLRDLDESDKALGGQGLQLDRAASRSGEGWLSLVLAAKNRHGAAERFRRIAERLGSPIANAPWEIPKDGVDNGILADVAVLWEASEPERGNGAAKASERNASHEPSSRYRIEFALVSRPHAA